MITNNIGWFTMIMFNTANGFRPSWSSVMFNHHVVNNKLMEMLLAQDGYITGTVLGVLLGAYLGFASISGIPRTPWSPTYGTTPWLRWHRESWWRMDKPTKLPFVKTMNNIKIKMVCLPWHWRQQTATPRTKPVPGQHPLCFVLRSDDVKSLKALVNWSEQNGWVP